MQKIIVTSAAFSGYSNIFTVDGDILDLGYLVNSSPEIDENLSLATLPFDIKFEVLERVVFSLLRLGKVRKSLQVLLCSNSQICRLFYLKYIGNYGLTRTEILDHLINLFNFIEQVVDSLFGIQAAGMEELVLSVFCRNSAIDVCLDKRWPLGLVDQSSFDYLPRVVNSDHSIVKVITGPAYSDIVWITGVEEDGIVTAEYLRGPVLILEVYSIVQGIRHVLYRQPPTFFKNVVKLLKVCLGKNSGVYMIFPVEGFLGVISEVY